VTAEDGALDARIGETIAAIATYRRAGFQVERHTRHRQYVVAP
jgi:hypothetical protein